MWILQFPPPQVSCILFVNDASSPLIVLFFISRLEAFRGTFCLISINVLILQYSLFIVMIYLLSKFGKDFDPYELKL